MRSICVFCGASRGGRPDYAEAARELAEALVRRQIGIVYGAGSIGLMGILADQAIALGGRVVGVIPQHLCSKEVLHEGLSELHITDTLLQRKSLMMDLADGFIALPGGLGTFDEILEVYTWQQLGQHDKPLGLINTAGYFEPFLTLLEQAIAEGFLRQEWTSRLRLAANPDQLLRQMLPA